MTAVTTLTALCRKGLEAGVDRTLLVHPDRTLTTAELSQESAELAAGLRDRGIGRGDRIALIMANRWEFAICDLAILRLGAVKVPINEMLPAGDIAYMLDHADVAAAIVGPSLAERAAAALSQAATEPLLVTIDAPAPNPLGHLNPLPFDTLTGDPTTLDDIEVAPADPAAIFYTGGTTGRPKGVLHTQQSLATNQLAQLLEAEIRSTDRLLLTTPLPHAAGLFLQSAIIRGATVHVLPAFDPDECLTYMHEHRISWTFLVPTMIYRLLDAAARHQLDLPELTTIVYGAAPIAPARLAEGLQRWGPVFIQLYGQTECPNWGTRLAKQDHLLDDEEVLSSCGRASLLADVAIVDDQGTFQTAGVTGEVALRSPYLLDRYWQNPEATLEKFVDGWIRTGDIGLLDEHGYLYLKDRRADMIISGGMNIYTTDVENAISRLPGVRQVAVIGVPHADWGEAVHAEIVADHGLDEAAVREHCREHLARYAVPKSLTFVDALPVTAYGKVDKKQLRSRYWAGRDRQIH